MCRETRIELNIKTKTKGIPKRSDLSVVTIEALKKLGGSGSISEIYEEVIKLLNLPDKIVNLLHKRFAEYYKSDIANYLDIETIEADDLRDLFGNKFAKFNQCSTKADVQEFVGNITGYIVINAQIEEIVADYFS